MRVRDLGSLAIAVDADERPVAGIRATAMLALLTINANRRVPVDALMDAAWGEQVRTGAGSSLETHIWRLRQLIEPRRTRRQPPTILVNDAGGYRLVVGAHSVDSLLFEELAGEVRDLLTAGHASVALARAGRALALWRGRPFGPLADREWARPTVARLDELHGQVEVRRIEALVATGALDQALSDLEPLIRAMPFREPLRALQMLALYRSGRAEEALACYRDTHRLLADEVGTEPGADLRILHRRILDDDVEPAPGPRSRPAGEPMRTVPPTTGVHLPATLTPLIGRDDVVAPLVELVTNRRHVTIVGAAGCGKTRVAVEIARTAAPAFPDGVWFVDLAAVPDPDLVTDVVISTIGFVASAVATRLAELSRYLRERRVLLVLDNCEHVLAAVARIVEAALAGGEDSGCAFLATSREPIGLAGETIWTLDPLRLPDERTGRSRATAPAVALFLQRLGSAAPMLAVDEHVLDRSVDICVALDGLPLPIELAAARARSHSLDDLAAQVVADPGGLGRLGRGTPDHRTTVRSAIEWSHRMLSPPERVAHRRIAVLPGPFTRSTAAAVIGEDGPPDVDDVLAQLVHRSMLTSDGARQRGPATTFRQLATVRAHARRALTEAGEDADVTDRRDGWTMELMAARPRLGRPAEIGWYHDLDDGYATVRATLARHLIEEPSAAVARLAPRLAPFWYYSARMPEGIGWLHRCCAILEGAGPIDILPARLGLASAMALQGHLDLARPHVDHVVAHLPLVAPEHVVEVGEGLVSLVVSAFVPAAWMPAAAELVVALHEQLGPVVERAGDPELALLADAAGCAATFAAGQREQAARDGARVHERATAAGNIMASWVSAAPPMLAAMLNADPDTGIPWFTRLAAQYTRLGTGGVGGPLEARANFAAQAGDHRLAVKLHAAARTEAHRVAMNWPRWELTRHLVELTREHLTPGDYEAARREGELRPVRDLLRDG